jgi:hypothetical protein
MRSYASRSPSIACKIALVAPTILSSVLFRRRPARRRYLKRIAIRVSFALQALYAFLRFQITGDPTEVTR